MPWDVGCVVFRSLTIDWNPEDPVVAGWIKRTDCGMRAKKKGGTALSVMAPFFNPRQVFSFFPFCCYIFSSPTLFTSFQQLEHPQHLASPTPFVWRSIQGKLVIRLAKHSFQERGGGGSKNLSTKV